MLLPFLLYIYFLSVISLHFMAQSLLDDGPLSSHSVPCPGLSRPAFYALRAWTVSVPSAWKAPCPIPGQMSAQGSPETPLDHPSKCSQKFIFCTYNFAYLTSSTWLLTKDTCSLSYPFILEHRLIILFLDSPSPHSHIFRYLSSYDGKWELGFLHLSCTYTYPPSVLPISSYVG